MKKVIACIGAIFFLLIIGNIINWNKKYVDYNEIYDFTPAITAAEQVFSHAMQDAFNLDYVVSNVESICNFGVVTESRLNILKKEGGVGTILVLFTVTAKNETFKYGVVYLDDHGLLKLWESGTNTDSLEHINFYIHDAF